MINSSILKNMPWSKEAEKWAKTAPGSDPADSDSAIQNRIKQIRDILKRPDPPSTPPKTVNASPVIEEDTSEGELTSEDRLSLGELQGDLRGWWKGNEEQVFYERLAKFKAKRGEGLMEAEVYDFWIEEWSRKVKEIAKLKPRT